MNEIFGDASFTNLHVQADPNSGNSTSLSKRGDLLLKTYDFSVDIAQNANLASPFKFPGGSAAGITPPTNTLGYTFPLLDAKGNWATIGPGEFPRTLILRAETPIVYRSTDGTNAIVPLADNTNGTFIDGEVGQVILNTPGAGFPDGTATYTPTGGTGTGCIVSATATGGAIVSVTVLNGGSGYTLADELIIPTPAPGSDAEISVQSFPGYNYFNQNLAFRVGLTTKPLVTIPEGFTLVDPVTATTFTLPWPEEFTWFETDSTATWMDIYTPTIDKMAWYNWQSGTTQATLATYNDTVPQVFADRQYLTITNISGMYGGSRNGSQNEYDELPLVPTIFKAPNINANPSGSFDTSTNLSANPYTSGVYVAEGKVRVVLETCAMGGPLVSNSQKSLTLQQ
tara:strand:- start:1527 stop:2720 length:1194 start_codon:yes stop_codon:yes gene_type:complete